MGFDQTKLSNGSTFSMNRLLYTKTVATIVDKDTKHFYGETNRDASSVIQQRKMLNLGKETPSNIKKETNDIRQAKKRVRNGGSVVPPKKIHRLSTSPIFY